MRAKSRCICTEERESMGKGWLKARTAHYGPPLLSPFFCLSLSLSLAHSLLHFVPEKPWCPTLIMATLHTKAATADFCVVQESTGTKK